MQRHPADRDASGDRASYLTSSSSNSTDVSLPPARRL